MSFFFFNRFLDIADAIDDPEIPGSILILYSFLSTKKNRRQQAVKLGPFKFNLQDLFLQVG